MSSRYVVGVDGSAPAEAALDWASRRAERDDAELILAHVDETEDGLMGEDFADETERRGRQLIRETLERVSARHPRLEVSTVLLRGTPGWALPAYVSDDDMLVIGTHKTGYLSGRVLGSRSVQVAAAAGCDVAVIPAVDLRFRTGVVVGIDRESTAEALGLAAAIEASARDDELLIMHADPTIVDEPSSSARHRSPIKPALEAARAAFPKLIVRSRVSMRPPAEALLDAARGKALLVLGPGSLDPMRSPIGSVMHEILLNANAPVLIARSVVLERSTAV